MIRGLGEPERPIRRHGHDQPRERRIVAVAPSDRAHTVSTTDAARRDRRSPTTPRLVESAMTHADLAVVEHERESIRGRVRVQRDDDTTGLEDAEQRCDERDRVGHDQRDPVALADPAAPRPAAIASLRRVDRFERCGLRPPR